MNKYQKWKAGLFRCPVPPACTSHWNDGNWMIWIDQHGEWLEETTQAQIDALARVEIEEMYPGC